MKYILHTLLFIIPVTLYAQVKPDPPQPPPGKGRIVIIFFMYRQIPQKGILNKLPVFLNDSLLCRLPNKTYSFHDVDTGIYTISADMGVKKPGPKAKRKEIIIEDGDIHYFEMVGVTEKIFRPTVELIKLRESEAMELLKQLPPLEDCGVTKPKPDDPFVNKKYFLSILTGNTFPNQNYRNWWPTQNQPLVKDFMPWIFGFEAGIRVAPTNHFLSFAFINNTQSAINDNVSGIKKWISINSIAIFYTYAFKLDKQNRFLILPKIGIGGLDYVLETRSVTGGGFQGEGSFTAAAAIQTEYRISRTFSIHANWDYLNGKVAFDNQDIRLNQHRLLAGIKAQF